MDSGVLCIYGEDPIQHLGWLRGGGDRHLLLVYEAGQLPPLHLLADPQVHFLSSGTEDETIKAKLWELLFLPISYRAAEEKNAIAPPFFARIEQLRAGIHLVASDYRDMGRGVLSNLLANFPLLQQAKEGKKLFGAFKDMPALIAGAGPSLERAVGEIRSWENRALLFAGGAALNALAAHSILPDFAAALDPHSFPERFAERGSFEVPLFYQSRVAHALLATTQGTRLWIPDSGGYPLERWMCEQLGFPDSSSFDAGWNVSTFSAALAVAMGCNPIVFVGLELSTPTVDVYAQGINEKIDDAFVETVDILGQKVYSKRDWQMAESWLNQFVKDHPDQLFLNATEGGLPLTSLPRMPLAEARKKYGEGMYDLKGRIHGKIATLNNAASESDLHKVSDKVKKSFKRCEELCIKLFSLFEKSYASLPGSIGERALCEVELEEEVAYTQFLAPLWEIWRSLFLRQDLSMDENLHRLLFFKRVLHNL